MPVPILWRLQIVALFALQFRWNFAPNAPHANQTGPRLQFRLPSFKADRLMLHLRVVGRPELDSEYTLIYRRDPAAAGAGESERRMNL